VGGTKFTVFEFEWGVQSELGRENGVWIEVLEQSLQFSTDRGG
jgi:hypothetical protein